MPYRLNDRNADQPEDQKAGWGESLTFSPGLGPKSVPEQQYSTEQNNSVLEARRVMTRYFEALKARDLKGISELCQFPFVSFEQVTPVVIESVDDLMSHGPPSMNMSEDPECWSNRDSFIQHGSYDTLHDIEILAHDPYAANLAMVYNRYGADGKMLLQCQGVYCVTHKDHKWGIELMSTIFTHAPLVGWRYPETEEAGVQVRMIHDIGPSTDDSEVDGDNYEYGPQTSVSGCKEFNSLPQNADNNDAMKSIRQSEGGPNNRANVDKYKDDWQWYRDIYDEIGLERWNWGFTVGVMPYSRVIHATRDKAHVFSGIIRYNTVNEEFDTSSEMSIVTWTRGRWGKAGVGAYITMHDRAGDIANVMA